MREMDEQRRLKEREWGKMEADGVDERRRKRSHREASGMRGVDIGVRIRTNWSHKDTRRKREEADGR